MKTNYYILLILLLSFSFSNAQSDVASTEVEFNNTVSVSEMNDEVTVAIDSTLNVVNEKEELLIDASEVKESIARASDIRIYLNRERKVENIKLLFPQINKAIKA